MRTGDLRHWSCLGSQADQGQVGLLHCNTIHGSNPNRSPERRIGLINDYTPPSARQSTGMGSGQLVRGEDRWGHFGAEPAPIGVCTRDDVLARRRILNSYPENVLMNPLGPDGVISFADEVAASRQGRCSIRRASRITRSSRRCRDMMLPGDRHFSPVIGGAGMSIRGIAVDRPSGCGAGPAARRIQDGYRGPKSHPHQEHASPSSSSPCDGLTTSARLLRAPRVGTPRPAAVNRSSLPGKNLQ